MYQEFFSTRKLLELRDIKKIASEYGSEFISYRGFYSNPLRQKFQLTATSLIPDPEYALSFLKSLKVCFEACQAEIEYSESDKEKVDLEAERKARFALLNTSSYVDVVMEWLSPKKKKLEHGNLWLVHFFIDPTIDADDGIDGFRAKCATSAWIQPDLTNMTLLANGSPKITATLYRMLAPVNSTTATAQTPLPLPIRHNNGINATSYDARVSGTKNQRYNLYGSWSENNSGIGLC